MKKTIKLIDLDCGHCADKIQNAVQKIDGVTSVSVNFLGQKMVLEAPDDRFDAILNEEKQLIVFFCGHDAAQTGHRLSFLASGVFSK